ncbi:acyl carrier protein, partial [Streptomyces sp. e14]|uniref:acyl carrier protein n=1 Tax=Streptomyces sp. e14 TaxID=645465 RepID=UPI0005BA43D2
VELRNRIGERSGLTLPTTLVFDYPTPADLVRKLLGDLVGEESGPAEERAGEPRRAADDDPVVLVAMGCRFPGG